MVIDSGQRQWAMTVGNGRAMPLTGQWVMVVGDDSGRLIVSSDNVLTWEVIEGKSGGGGRTGRLKRARKWRRGGGEGRNPWGRDDTGGLERSSRPSPAAS